MTTLANTRNGGGRQASREAQTGTRRARPFQLTARDLELLEFVAAHRFVLAAHVRQWLGVSEAFAYRRLRGLAGVGLLNHRRIFHAQPGCYLITNGGLAVIDSELPRPTIDLRTYGHDVGVVWLWLAAREGRFGPPETLLSERLMRSCQQRSDRAAVERFGVPVDGYDRSGRPRVHYPDLLVIAPDGGRAAVELELTVKGRRRLERILVGYRGEPRIRQVVYLTASGPVARAVTRAASACGVEELVDVRYFQARPPRAASSDWSSGFTGGELG